MVYFIDVLCRMCKLERDALAVPASRKAPAFDHRYFMRHFGVHRIVGDRVDAGLRDNLTRLVSINVETGVNVPGSAHWAT